MQDSRERMMEQERFAFLGQMIGGLAHNLKTPIMSIAGCISAAESLIDECLDSLDDPAVTATTTVRYREIRDWFGKVKGVHGLYVRNHHGHQGQANSVSAVPGRQLQSGRAHQRTRSSCGTSLRTAAAHWM
jgi:signal transduction histidine kinase